MTMKKRGQANLALGVATTAIVLVVLVIVLGQLTTTGSTAVSSSTQATAAFGNVTNYMWVGIQLVGVGILLIAGLGLVALLMRR